MWFGHWTENSALTRTFTETRRNSRNFLSLHCFSKIDFSFKECTVLEKPLLLQWSAKTFCCTLPPVLKRSVKAFTALILRNRHCDSSCRSVSLGLRSGSAFTSLISTLMNKIQIYHDSVKSLKTTVDDKSTVLFSHMKKKDFLLLIQSNFPLFRGSQGISLNHPAFLYSCKKFKNKSKVLLIFHLE